MNDPFRLILEPPSALHAQTLLRFPSNIARPSTSTIPKLTLTCSYKPPRPQSIPMRTKAHTPVGSPLRTAPPRPTHPFFTASNPPRSTAARPALPALLEEPMSCFTTQKTKPDVTDSGRARGVSRITRPSLERRRRLSPGR